MSEFSELIKSFRNSRDYIREFYIYGFKGRKDYQGKSGRTYDNERRRIESWLADFVKSSYGENGKSIFLRINSNMVDENPLYTVWKTKSFTDNDIMLHFFLLDILKDHIQRDIREITDELMRRYQVLFEDQTVRIKCREYVKEGLFEITKNKKRVCYSIHATLKEALIQAEDELSELLSADEEAAVTVESESKCIVEKHECPEDITILENLLLAVKFFQAALPIGVVGNTILENQDLKNDIFRMKHDFIVHTLEDEILLTLFRAMNEQKNIILSHHSALCEKVHNHFQTKGVPLKILISVQTGRRYVCLYIEKKRQFAIVRLDRITEATSGEDCANYSNYADNLKALLPLCWGVSMNESGIQYHIRLVLSIHEKTHSFIIQRLKREGRSGIVTRLEENLYQYEGIFFDVNEMLPWIRTFTGRIVSLETNNKYVMNKFHNDLRKMYEMYSV